MDGSQKRNHAIICGIEVHTITIRPLFLKQFFEHMRCFLFDDQAHVCVLQTVADLVDSSRFDKVHVCVDGTGSHTDVDRQVAYEVCLLFHA